MTRYINKTIFLLISALFISACTTRTDGGARVRPFNNVQQPSTVIPDGIPLQQIPPIAAIENPSTSNEVIFPNTNTPYPQQNSNSVDAPTATTGAVTTANTETYTPSTAQPNPTSTQQSAYVPSKTPNNAVQTLLNEANVAVKNNQLDKAASALDRAVRLEPRNASIWYDLAQIRLHQGKYAQSEQMAKKSIDFAAGNQDLIKKNWKIISVARKALGNTVGAQEAERYIR